MVSYKPSGRLGNAMFQICTMIAYAEMHDLKFSMPVSTGLEKDKKWNPVYFQHLVDPSFQQFRADVSICEKTPNKYEKIPFKADWRDEQIILKGYWQNPKYFQDYRSEIIDILGFNSLITTGNVGVHVRRGDYLTLLDKHIVSSKEWYERAMKMFPGKRLIFFSDDIEWCKKEFWDRDDCVFMDAFDELTDLFLLSKCEHNINSSSTFSWMGAWLNNNPNKIVVCPDRWMTPKASNEWTEEIIPKEWIRLK